MSKRILTFLSTEVQNLEQAGLLRREIAVQSPPGPIVTVGNKELLNLATGDYLGLAGHAGVKRAAKTAIDAFGVGTASPRMVTGTLPIHLELERALTRFLHTEETVVLGSGYHANTGLFESLLSDRDYIFCDEETHPSLADGVRLSRAKVFSYRTNDMDHLEDRLKRSRAARFRFIVTDGVLPLAGLVANLKAIYDLAQKYDALVVVDDGQGVGVLGATGRGAHEELGLGSQIDLLTGTFSNALGGGAGGYVSGRRDIITWLRQKSRPYLVSAALAPAAAAAALEALRACEAETGLRTELRQNIELTRTTLTERGFKITGGQHPILIVLTGDAVATQRMSDLLYRKGILVMGFCHPVVPEGAARLRLQISAKHAQRALRNAIHAMEEARRELKLA